MAESLLARTNLNLLWIICLTSYVYLPLNSRGTFVLWQVVLVAPMHTFYCVTQLKLYTVDKLSSPIFCCLWGIGVTRPNLHFFQYIQANKPFTDPVPPNTKQYQLILIKYQPVSSYTDPVPSSTTYNSSSRKAQFSQLNNFSFYDSFDESRTVYLV